MSWNRNRTRFELSAIDSDNLKLRLKKQAQIIPIPQKEEIFSSILHLSKQIQFYDSQAQTDGSLNRFFGNSLPLVLGHITGKSVDRSFRDLRNTMIEIEEKWERGGATLRKHRMDIYRTLSFHFESLEMLKNAAIAEQLQIVDICPQFPKIVQTYINVLARWRRLDIVAQVRKLSIQLNQITRFGKLDPEPSVPQFWYNQLRESSEDIDKLQLQWKQLQSECTEALESIISEQRLDPLTTIPFILGEIIEKFGEDKAQNIQERLSIYFLEKRAGLNRFEIVPEELYARYEWNTESILKSLPQGERFTNIEPDEDNLNPPIDLSVSENYPLNAQIIERICDIYCSPNANTRIEENIVHIQTLFPTKYKLDQLRQQPNQVLTPFKFTLKSTLLHVWGNVVKWDIKFNMTGAPWMEFLDNLYAKQSGLKQSFGFESPDKIWQNYLQHAFSISYPGEESMVTLAEDRIQLIVTEHADDSIISIHWKTILDGDNIIPVANQKGEIPLVFTLKQTHAFLYPLLSVAQIESIEIKSSVLELQDIEVYNDYGKIDPSTPFNVFGTKPELGSKLFLGHPLIFCNALDNLKINWQWFGLPDNPGGFSEYYNGYDIIKTNEDFLVSVSALKSGTWVPEVDKQLLPLFATTQNTEGHQGVSNIRRINELDLTRLELRSKQKSFEPLKDPQKSKYGYLCLELVNPLGAFGHNRYAEFVQRRMGEQKKQAFLHEPYTPSMGNISLEAELSEVITRKELSSKFEVSGIDAFFLAKDASPSTTLMPNDAYLSGIYLKLDSLPDNMCSLYFELPDGISQGHVNTPKEWSYWNGLQWLKIEQDQIIRDETLHFESSGLVILGELNVKDDELPKWIRIGSYHDEVLQHRKNIHTQIVKFDITAPKGLKQIEEISQIHIPDKWSDTLLSLEPLNTKKIVPPSLYFGNTDLLSIQFRIQNRIFTYQDLKHLLLIKFPKIQEILLLSHQDGDTEIAPGHIRVIVIPKTEANKLQQGEWPQLNSQEISTIKRFLEENAPMGVQISVENPMYEEIVVKGNIVIEAGIDSREARHIIHQRLLEGILEVSGILQTGLSFGQNLYSSKILVVLRNISFVKSVTNFACYTRLGEYLNLPKEFNSLNYRIEPSQINHILIPGKSHLIDIKINGQHNSDGIGVSNMTLGTDFLVDRLNQYQKAMGIGNHQVGMTLMIEEDSNTQEQQSNQIRL